MEQAYYVRGKKVTIEELDGVVAVRTSEKTTDVSASADPQRESLAEYAGSLTTSKSTPDDDRAAFEKAGWRFVAATPSLRSAIASRTPPAGTQGAARVFRHPSGRILVGVGRMTVRLRPDLDEAGCLKALDKAGLDIVRRLKFAPNLFEVMTRPGRDFLQASLDLHGDPEFVYAEPQFIEHVPQRLTPTDPSYGDQWHLSNTGQNGGTAGADISAELAWDTTRAAGVRLSVVDNGFDVAHPDLAAAFAASSGFFADDGMGGANFVTGLAGYPDNGHGTFCAGMAIARANNAEDGCGVANQADFIAVACMGDQVGTQATLGRAIAYAVDPAQEGVAGVGADVISCSLGPNGADWEMEQVLQDAIDFAVTNGRGGLGTPIFWAVTNGNFEIQFDEVCSYANVIAVGRSTRTDNEDNCGHGPELQFLATGVDVSSTQSGGGFGTNTGTSFAAPTAAGVGALVVAVNPDLTWDEVRDAIRDSCDKIGGNVYDANGHSDDFGFGRVNAAAALCEASHTVTLDTPGITFNDVPEGETTARAIVFSVRSCDAATFQIVAGPTVLSGPGSFGTLPSPTAALAAATGPTLRQARLWLSHAGTSDGDVTTGEVTVRLVETAEEWTIPITANTIANPTVGCVMVLDQSGSMLDPSGLPAFATRADVLRFAAPVFVNVLPENDGIGIVAFDHDAYPRMDVTAAGPVGPFDPARAAALGQLSGYAPNPAGMTAIGDGVELAHNTPNAAGSAFDHRAMVVFTDGHETAAKYIADVAPLIDERVFAIGLGTPSQIQPAALQALTNGTGGYLLLTGNLGSDDAFLLSKYYLQILAGVTNQDIVLDPEGALLPGQKHRIPFRLNEADITADTILLSQGPASLLRFSLETPAGDVITPATAAAGLSFTAHQALSFYRMTLPVPIGVAGAAAGKWHVVLEVDKAGFKKYLSSLDNYPQLYRQVAAHGIRYNLSVQSSSGIRLQARLVQSGNEPGATLTVRATPTEYGIPIEGGRIAINAELTRPDNTQALLVLSEVEPGVFEASTVASMPGVYPIRVLANGKSLRGRPFTREQLLTGAVWRGGDNPPPTGDGDADDGHERLCKLLACLLGKAIKPELARRLEAAGLDIAALRECLRVWCRRDRVATPTKPGVAFNTPGLAALAQALGPKATTALVELARGLEADQDCC